jgi:hypothetical protein
VSPKQLQPWAQVNHILGFKITHQVDINFPVGESKKLYSMSTGCAVLFGGNIHVFLYSR